MFGERPRVTLTEWREKVRPALSNQGFDGRELDRLEGLFQQCFHTHPGRKAGIDESTLDQTLSYFRANPNGSEFDQNEWAKVEAVLRKYISERT